MKWVAVGLTFFPLLIFPVYSKSPREIPCTRHTILVDGRLDEPVWAEALPLELKYEVEPGENITASHKTRCWLISNESGLYVAFQANEPRPDDIRAFLDDRDASGDEDWVGIVLDTFDDERNAYVFRSNPLGIQTDGMRKGSDTDLTFDAIWDCAGCITRRGYMVEMFIPFNAIRFPKHGELKTWGIDLVRHMPRDRQVIFAHTPRNRNHNNYLAQLEKFAGFKNASPGRNLEFMPSLIAFRSDIRKEGAMVQDDSQTDFGVTGQWGMTTNMTLSATVNPDFSQVEADALQMDINQPFALYYAEKRPFFVESADYFRPRATDFLEPSRNPIYTRAIRDPSWGVKLTGKDDRNTVGVFLCRDEITNLLFPGNQYSQSVSHAESNLSSVFRYSREMSRRVIWGTFITNRQTSGYYSRLAGLDSELRVTDTDLVQIQIMGSQARYSDEDSRDWNQPHGDFSGMAADINFRHNARTLDFWARFQHFDRGFRADLGYMPRVNYRRYRVGSSYTWHGSAATWYSRIILNSELDIAEDLNGEVLNGGLYLWGSVQGPLQSFATCILGRTRQQYAGHVYQQESLYLAGSFQPLPGLNVGLDLNMGDHIDFVHARPADLLQVMPRMSWNIGTHFRMSLSGAWETLAIKLGTLYTAVSSDCALTYQFNKRWFVRSVLQFIDYQYKTHLYPLAPQKNETSLFSQFLISCKVNPRTVFFLGYSDNHDGHRQQLMQQNRVFFAKLGYAWQI